jgi:hypothetical protein
MQEDINLTHRLSQFRSAAPAPRPPVPLAGPVERRLHPDRFLTFAVGLFVVFFAAQFVMMTWFVFHR